MLEVVVGRDQPDAPQSTWWFTLPAIAVLVSPIFARRRFPLAALVGFWALSVATSLIDWRLIPFAISLFVVGLSVSFLLGNLRDISQASLGLLAAVGGSGTVVYLIEG